MTPLQDRGIIERLLELIAALDRRQPQRHRPQERQIERDAQTLRTKAEARLDELDGTRGPRRLGIDGVHK